MAKVTSSARTKERKIKRNLEKIPNVNITMTTQKQLPRKVKNTNASKSEHSNVAKQNVLDGAVFQNDMTNILRTYGIGKTKLRIPHIIPVTGKPSKNKISEYDFYDEINNIVYEMTTCIGNSKAGKMEGDVLSVKIWNPDSEYIAIVEVEKGSEAYRKNKPSFDLIEEQVDRVIYGEDELREHLRNVYQKTDYYEGNLIDINIDDIDMLETNRDINSKWVDTLYDYILKYGFITNIVVVPYIKDGNLRYKIIDGNHRFEAKKRLIANGIYPKNKEGVLNTNKIQVYNLEWIDGNNNGLVHRICIQMNMTNKAWDNYDYIQSYIKFFDIEGLTTQLADYELLASVYNEFGQSMTALYLTVNEGLMNYEKGMGKVKEGKWACDREIYNHITRDLLDLMREITENNTKYGKYTKSALQWLLTFVKIAMIERHKSGDFIKLFSYFKKNIASGKYKQYANIELVKQDLIPELSKDFANKFPVNAKL